MRQKTLSIPVVCISLLLIGMLSLAFNIQQVKATETIYIQADGSVDPPTAPIQRVGDVYTLTSNISDAIVVERGNITIDGRGHTIQGTGAYFSKGINLYGISNVTVKNANIRDFYFGIYLNSTSSNVVSGSNLTDNQYGIIFKSSSHNTIRDNRVESNNYGIYFEGGLPSSSDNEIYNNRIASNTWESINVRYSSNNQIHENTITDNGESIKIEGDFPVEASHNLISKNNITANLAGSWGAAVKLGPYSNYNVVQGNNIINSGSIMLYSSSNNKIYENNITHSEGFGLNLVFSSKQNTIQRNNLTDNKCGIILGGYLSVSYKECPENNTIYDNNIANSRENGTQLGGSLNSFFYHNNFQNNTQQISITNPNATSTWDNGYPSGGNYWSDYTGTDGNGDGIGDSPYIIDEKNRDSYPLMNAWTPSEHEPTPQEVTVGVKAGDWIKCTYSISRWPTGTPNPEWLKVEFLSVEGTVASVRVTMRMSNGTELSETVPVDVVAGGQACGLSGFVIPANSKVGDIISFGGFGFTSWATIEGEATRTYAGASRTVVYASFSQLGVQLTYYWDKQTGVMVEASTNSGSVTATGRATETNIWQAQQEPFPTWIIGVAVATIALAAAAILLRRKRKQPTKNTTDSLSPPA